MESVFVCSGREYVAEVVRGFQFTSFIYQYKVSCRNNASLGGNNVSWSMSQRRHHPTYPPISLFCPVFPCFLRVSPQKSHTRDSSNNRWRQCRMSDSPVVEGSRHEENRELGTRDFCARPQGRFCHSRSRSHGCGWGFCHPPQVHWGHSQWARVGPRTVRLIGRGENTPCPAPTCLPDRHPHTGHFLQPKAAE
jgi:hypothetical protein